MNILIEEQKLPIMGILIEGQELPISCGDCMKLFLTEGRNKCPFLWKNFGDNSEYQNKKRMPDCPLVKAVRCKDCKYKVVPESGEYTSEDIVCYYWQSDGLTENDFCSQGKEQEDE